MLPACLCLTQVDQRAMVASQTSYQVVVSEAAEVVNINSRHLLSSMRYYQKRRSKHTNTSSIGLPDSTACGSKTFAVGSFGRPKISASFVAGMSIKTSSHDLKARAGPMHWILDVGL